MALIVREEIKHDCIMLGLEIQDQILGNQKNHTSTVLLTGVGMKSIIEKQGIVDRMVERIEKTSQKELDEYVGQEEDKKEEEDRDAIISERRAALEDSAMFNGSRINRDIAERAANLPGFTLVQPRYNINRIDDDDLMDDDDTSDIWDDHLPVLEMDEDEDSQFESLVGGGMSAVINFIKDEKSVEDIKEKLIDIPWVLLDYTFFKEGMIKLATLIVDRKIPTTKSNGKRKRFIH